MRLLRNKSVTLIELLLAIAILGLMILGISNLELFSRYQVTSSDRRAKLQHEASFVLEHMAKEIIKAIGDINRPPIDITATIGTDPVIIAWTDYDNDGRWDGAPEDKQIAYRYNPSTYEIWYYGNYTDNPNSYRVITSRCVAPDFGSVETQPTFRTYNSANNYIYVQITACWDPDGSPSACGTSDNPSITMRSRIGMPSVSVN